MDNGTYRKNVMKTLSIKGAKLSLKLISRNTARTNIFHASLGLATECIELQSGLAAYVTGASRLLEPMSVNAFEECGDIGYYLAVLAKFLKVKLPGAGKKVRLKNMTRTEALLNMTRLAGDILDLSKKYMYGPVMKTELKDKVVNIKDASGAVTGQETKQVEVQVIDVDATEAKFNERLVLMKAKVEEFALLYWPFVYETFDVPPANVNVGNIAKLSNRYPSGFFELSEAEDRDTDAEVDAMQTAAATPSPA